MTGPHNAGDTVDTGLLVRLLHGELDAQQESELTQHLTVCPYCRALADALQLRLQEASTALQLAAHDAPAAAEWQAMLQTLRAGAGAGRRAARVRIAAGWIIALLAVTGLSRAPVRAWLAQRWGLMSAAPAAVPEPPAQSVGRAGLVFAPGSTRLDVAVQTTQPAGALVLRYTDEATVQVTVSGGGTEQLAWRRGSIRIVNQPDARASYYIALPRSVQRLSVQVGRMDVVNLSQSELQDSLVIGLEARAVRKPASRDES
jgi:hypothetical protein